jgi:hypothetical protein
MLRNTLRTLSSPDEKRGRRRASTRSLSCSIWPPSPRCVGGWGGGGWRVEGHTVSHSSILSLSALFFSHTRTHTHFPVALGLLFCTRRTFFLYSHLVLCCKLTGLQVYFTTNLHLSAHFTTLLTSLFSSLARTCLFPYYMCTVPQTYTFLHSLPHSSFLFPCTRPLANLAFPLQHSRSVFSCNSQKGGKTRLLKKLKKLCFSATVLEVFLFCIHVHVLYIHVVNIHISKHISI